MNNSILLVDDEINIIYGYQRNLRNRFNVHIAESAKEGLEINKLYGPFAVVVADYRMPEMDGIKFLSLIKQTSPDTVRIMLTGHADIQLAVNAINEGNIFRFLTKPCSEHLLTSSLETAIEHYRLITSERELLDKTLKGSIKVLVDILSIANPVAFSKATRLSDISKMLAARLNYIDLWEVEIASLLSQIGCIAVPEEILKKKYSNKLLTFRETEIYNSHPQIGKIILKNIPRLEKIAEAIEYQLKNYTPLGEHDTHLRGEEIPFIARLLRIVNDFDSYMESGGSYSQALTQMNKDKYLYDPEILAALETELTGIDEGYILKTMNLSEIKTGMIPAEDIKDINGQTLISKGHEISDIIKICLINFSQMNRIKEPIKVVIPTKQEKFS